MPLRFIFDLSVPNFSRFSCAIVNSFHIHLLYSVSLCYAYDETLHKAERFYNLNQLVSYREHLTQYSMINSEFNHCNNRYFMHILCK